MKKLLVSCALATMTFAAAPQALKATDSDGQCPLQNATLRGTYMVTGGGTIVGVGPLTAVGTITYDGKGNSVNIFTVSVNGAISRGVVTGPYTVNRDCTGTLEIPRFSCSVNACAHALVGRSQSWSVCLRRVKVPTLPGETTPETIVFESMKIN
jgi:hypothetical protein